jgi:papain fold toxin 1 (glutamine deamidase) of polymorphic toxin system
VNMVDNPTGCNTNCALTADATNDVLGGGGPVRVGASGPTPFAAIDPKYNTGWFQTATFSRIASLLSARGPGARAIVIGEYAIKDPNAPSNSHAFNAVNWKGKIYGVDAQAGGKADVTGYNNFWVWVDNGQQP